MRQDHGDPRYPKRQAAVQRRMVIDGQDVGAALSPADVYIELKRLLELDDDEILEGFRLGAAALPEQDPEGTLMRGLDDVQEAATAALAVSPSRLKAWRKRMREMTWDELRVLMIGLRPLVLGERR